MGLTKRHDSSFYWASYTGPDGKRVRRSTGTGNRKEAEAILARWKDEAFQAQKWGVQPQRTFEEVIVLYLKETEKEKRPGGHQRALYAVQALRPFFAGRSMNRLGAADVNAYIQMRYKAGRAAATINRELGVLSSAINHACRHWEWDLPNPVAGRKPKNPEGRVRWLRPEEARDLIRAAEANGQAPHLPDFIRLAVNTGCRKQELLGLEWSRVDLQRKLFVLESLNTKTNRRRAVPLNGAAWEALMGRMRFRAERCPASPWVFAHENGHRIQDVKKSFRSACNLAGVTDFRIHDLRHTCAAWLVTNGVPLAEVRDLLGHTTIRMTEKYAHLAPENVRAAVETLPDLSRLCHVGEIGVVEKNV